MRDIDGVRIYLERQRPSSAANFGVRLNEAWDLLARMPLLGRLARSSQMLGRGFRAFIVDEYVAYYKVREDSIEIYRVVHGARRLQAGAE